MRSFLNLVSGLLTLALLYPQGMMAQQGKDKPLAALVKATVDLKSTDSYDPFVPVSGKLALRQSLDEHLNNYKLAEPNTSVINEVLDKKPRNIILKIATEGISLILVKHRVLSDDFVLYDKGDGLSQTPMHYEGGVHYRGIVEGDYNSFAAVSFFENEVSGTVSIKGRALTFGKIRSEKDEGKHIIYYEERSNLKTSRPSSTCDAVELPGYQSARRFKSSGGDNVNNCVRMHFECADGMFATLGSLTAVANYVTNLFNVVQVLYENESIELIISEIRAWTATDPYNLTTRILALEDFTTAMENYAYNADLAALISWSGASGGRAYVNTLDSPSRELRTSYSNILGGSNPFPTYSSAVSTLSHEIGHNLGSHHTHRCSWSGGNQIDDCGNHYIVNNGADDDNDGTVDELDEAEGNACFDPLNPIIPAGGGTIMSYCHLNAVGVDFNLGFGQQPGDRIRDRVYGSTRLIPCCDANGTEVLIGTESNPEDYVIEEYIVSTQHITSAVGAPGLNYFAGNDIELNPGFRVDRNAVFCATIGNCHAIAAPLLHGISKFDGNGGSVTDKMATTIRHSLHPNPSTGIFYLDFEEGKISGDLIVFDITGALVLKLKLEDLQQVTIDLSEQSNGVFLLKVISPQGVINTRIIKQH